MTTLKPNTRVKLPKHPASYPNTTYWFGTFTGNDVVWEGKDKPDHWLWSKGNADINCGLLPV